MTDQLRLEGKLRLKAAQRLKWLRSPLQAPDPDRYAEAGFGTLSPESIPSGTVQELLDTLLRDRRARVRLTYARSPVVLSGLIPRPAVALYWPALVGALVQAANWGGTGEVALIYARTHAMRVRLDGTGSVVLETANLREEAAAASEPVRIPGVIEPAKTGRATCRVCKHAISAGTLRFGAQDVGKSRPGKPSYRWLHLACAARALPHSFGPVLREYDGPVEDREELWTSLPRAAREASRPRAFDKGDPVVTDDGRAGEVVWFGPDRYGSGLRVGIKVGPTDEDIVWLPDDQVRPR